MVSVSCGGVTTLELILPSTLSAINIANDFLLLVFPIPILLKLNASARVRVILVVTLTCGLVYHSPFWQQNVQITDDSTGLPLHLS